MDNRTPEMPVIDVTATLDQEIPGLEPNEQVRLVGVLAITHAELFDVATGNAIPMTAERAESLANAVSQRNDDARSGRAVS